MGAANALLVAIHAKLAGDAGLTAMTGPDRISDRLQASTKLPIILFGPLETRDLSTATEGGEEHFVTLEVWSDAEGRRQVGEIAARIEALLDDAALTLQGAVLVSLLRIGSRTRRQPNTRAYTAELRFRAVTE